MTTHVMWFRKDLRLEDNTAFYHALESLATDNQLLCVFHLDEQQFQLGSNSHDYFFTALKEFIRAAEQKNITIHLLSGQLIPAFTKIKKLYPDWQQLFFNLDKRGFGQKRDLAITTYLTAQGIAVSSFEEHHLLPATAIKKADGTPYKKFTPYYRQWQSWSKPTYHQLNLQTGRYKIVKNSRDFQTGKELLTQLLRQRKTDYRQQVGEAKANERLNDFVLNHLADYDQTRDYPAVDGTSQLSPYLATGQLSIRKVWQACEEMPWSSGQETFMKELAWRDFYHMIYFFNPKQYQQELQEKYRQLKWQTNEELLKKWQQGQTGYPIIDAAMRQLNQTGWMHNRLRMLSASFLTKDLLLDWRLGERYFAEKLIDYDAASNIGGWQWAASTGTDAAPYFRIFNPTTQGLKFDKEAAFITKFVPELNNLPVKYRHQPELLTTAQAETFEFTLGKDYPLPIVNHAKARERALAWFKHNGKPS